MLHDGQVVRNEYISEIHVALQIFQQIYYLCLNGHVERRNRLVADDKTGLQGKRARNADTLTLTAAELVRISFKVVSLQAALLHRVENVLPVLLSWHYIVLPHRFSYDFADRHTGRKTGIRVLKII